jgi:hypothetical protein
MTNKKRGYYTLTIGGKKRTLHFSMNFWASFTDVLGISLSEIDKVFSSELNLTSIRALVYAGILSYDQEEGNEIDYNIYKVGAWLDDVTTEQFNEMVQTLTESRLLGNDLNGGIRRNVVKTTKDTKK